MLSTQSTVLLLLYSVIFQGFLAFVSSLSFSSLSLSMPVCGKLTNFDPQNPAETNWPWLAAIYRLPVASKLGKLSVTRTKGTNIEAMEEESDMDGWQLVCSGALVNQRSVVVAAHCVTELGKLYPLDTAKIRVVLGKQYRSDLRVTKGLQRLRVSLYKH